MSSKHAGWSFVSGFGFGLLLATAALFFFLIENWQTAIAGVMAGVGLLLALLGGWRALAHRARTVTEVTP